MKKLFSSGEKPFKDLSILRLAGEVGTVFRKPRKTSEILKMNATLRYFLSLTETGQQSDPHIQLEMPRQSQQCKGTAEVLSRIILAQRLCHVEIKVFGSIFTTVMGKCTVMTLLDDTNLNSFQTF